MIDEKVIIKKIYEADCCRCGGYDRVEDLEAPLINQVTLLSLNGKGEILPDYGKLDYYICHDCWNDLLEFFKK